MTFPSKIWLFRYLSIALGCVFILFFIARCDQSPDPNIDRLVADLTATHGMWLNGYIAEVPLPRAAPLKQVLAQCFKHMEFHVTKQGVKIFGGVTHFTILKVQRVRIPIPFQEERSLYTAVLVRTDFGDKIFILRPEQNWWWRCYDADGHYGPLYQPPLHQAIASLDKSAWKNF